MPVQKKPSYEKYCINDTLNPLHNKYLIEYHELTQNIAIIIGSTTLKDKYRIGRVGKTEDTVNITHLLPHNIKQQNSLTIILNQAVKPLQLTVCLRVNLGIIS